MSVFAVAGYKENMFNCLFKSNPGLIRRFTQFIDLTVFKNSDLKDIFHGLLTSFQNVNEFTHNDLPRRMIDDILFDTEYKDANDVVRNFFPNQAGSVENLMLIYEQTFRYRARNNEYSFEAFEREVIQEYLKTYRNDFAEVYDSNRTKIPASIENYYGSHSIQNGMIGKTTHRPRQHTRNSSSSDSSQFGGGKTKKNRT